MSALAPGVAQPDRRQPARAVLRVVGLWLQSAALLFDMLPLSCGGSSSRCRSFLEQAGFHAIRA